MNSKEARAHVLAHATILRCAKPEEFWLPAAELAKLKLEAAPDRAFVFGLVTAGVAVRWTAMVVDLRNLEANPDALKLVYQDVRNRLAKALTDPADEKRMREAGSQVQAPRIVKPHEAFKAPAGEAIVTMCLDDWHALHGHPDPVCPRCKGTHKESIEGA